MRPTQTSFTCKAVAVGTLTITLALSGLGMNGWATMGSYNMKGSVRHLSQTYSNEEPTITILRPASISTSDTHLRTEPPLWLSNKKRLGMLLIFLGVAAEEEA